MMSHHVTCHVTSLSHTSSLSKRKEKQNKIPIKSENKIKLKLKLSKVSHNNSQELQRNTVNEEIQSSRKIIQGR